MTRPATKCVRESARAFQPYSRAIDEAILDEYVLHMYTRENNSIDTPAKLHPHDTVRVAGIP